jgi:HlyD family secretion protein
MKKNKGKKIIWIFVVLLTCAIIASYVVKSKSELAVETVAVEKGDIRLYLEDTAVIQCKEKQTVYVEGSGKITDINIDVGDTVKKGDIVLVMDKGDLELQLRDANAKVAAAKAQLKGTEFANYANKIEIAKAAVEQASLTYESALRSFETTKKLFETGSISEEELNKSQDAYKAAQAALNSANLQLDEIMRGTPDYVKSGYASQLEQAIIFRDNILRSMGKLQVKAPIDGVVLEKFVEVSSTVAQGTAAFAIGNIGMLELQADILADDGYKVRVGNEVEISGKVIEDAIIKGKVAKIAPMAKTVASTLGVNQRRVPITIEMTENVIGLKPGYSVDIQIITFVKNDALKVPDTSVFDYKGKSCIIAIENNKTVVKEVEKGLEGDRVIEIVNGIEEGDIILIKPDNNVKEGMSVEQVTKE